VVPPGVDLDTFRPGGPGGRRAARRALGIDLDADLVLFVGRIQPLKAPDVLVRAVAELLARSPHRRGRLQVAVLGGPSGTGLDRPDELAKLVADLGLDDVVQFHPPAPRARLSQWYRAADLVAVPSYSESFGLVAVEAQACGTPVLAARVGGLPTAVADGESGLLVDGHDAHTWAVSLDRLLSDRPTLDRMGRKAVERAGRFSWEATVLALQEVYARAVSDHRRDVGGAVGMAVEPLTDAFRPGRSTPDDARPAVEVDLTTLAVPS
jgi:D-inositol-3-phosphate glycosyltransferase